MLAKDRETASIVIDDLGLDTAPESLVGSIDAAQTPETVIIQITARAGTPEDAQELADAWVGALAERVSDIEAAKGGQGMRIEVSESAQLPTSPVSPNVQRNVLLGAVLGALLGAGYAVARTLLDRRLRSTEDVERAAQLSVVGSVPDLGKHDDLFVTASGVGTHAQAAEAIRRLRTNLSYMDVDNPPRAIVVTSPKQGDGKSTVAANLAAAIALSGQPVTLVDCDLRRPNVSRSLGLDDTVGLTDVLAGRVQLVDAVQEHPEITGLSVLTSGSRPPNPSEILGSQAMRGVVADLVPRRHGRHGRSPAAARHRRRGRRAQRRRRAHHGERRPHPRHRAHLGHRAPARGARPAAGRHPQPGVAPQRGVGQLRPLRLRARRLRRHHRLRAEEQGLRPVLIRPAGSPARCAAPRRTAATTRAPRQQPAVLATTSEKDPCRAGSSSSCAASTAPKSRNAQAVQSRHDGSGHTTDANKVAGAVRRTLSMISMVLSAERRCAPASTATSTSAARIRSGPPVPGVRTTRSSAMT